MLAHNMLKWSVRNAKPRWVFMFVCFFMSSILPSFSFSLDYLELSAVLSSWTMAMCTNLPFGRNLQKKHPAVSSQIPVSFVIMIDRDQSSEGYSVGGRDWPFSPLCYPPARPGSCNEPVKGMIWGWEVAINPQ